MKFGYIFFPAWARSFTVILRRPSVFPGWGSLVQGCTKFIRTIYLFWLMYFGTWIIFLLLLTLIVINNIFEDDFHLYYNQLEDWTTVISMTKTTYRMHKNRTSTTWCSLPRKMSLNTRIWTRTKKNGLTFASYFQ